MELGNILSADVLDIIFDQRNKEYGAYDLRKNYQQRLTTSLMVTLLLVTLICVTYILLGAMKTSAPVLMATPDITLEKIREKERPFTIEPSPQKAVPAQVKTIKDMVPLTVKDNVPINDPVPEQGAIEDAKIGNVTTPGPDDIGIVSPPVNENSGIVTVPQQHNSDDGIFKKVEIDAQYPGGMDAWRAFLFRRLVYPQEAIDDRTQGTVYVEFIVDKEGNVSDVTALSGPQELFAAAVSVIQKSGRWEPGIQNGQKVKSYKHQPITFKLSDD